MGIYNLDDIYSVLSDISEGIRDLNQTLKSIQGNGVYNSIGDINDKLDDIMGVGAYNSINDICDKLDPKFPI